MPAIGVDVGGTLTKLVYFEPNDEDEPEGELEAKVLKNIRRYLTKNSAYGKTGHRDIHLQVSETLNFGIQITFFFFDFNFNRPCKRTHEVLSRFILLSGDCKWEKSTD